MNNFHDRLHQAMIKKEITASELARVSGVGKSDISNYINGKYLPKADKVYLLAKALSVDPGWLMTGVEQKKQNEQDDTPKESVKLLIRGLNKLSPEQLEQATAMFKVMFAPQYNERLTLIFLTISYGFLMVLHCIILPKTALNCTIKRQKKIPKPLIYKDLGK